jgi:predicted lipoprotein with Yx(FWY)xxD motif
MERMPNRTGDVAGRLRLGVFAVAAAAALAVGACSAPSGAGLTVAPTTAAVATTAPGSAAPASANASYTTLAVAKDATLGAYVTGRDGMTLYIFTPDSGTTSACVDKCATSWPPLTVEDAEDVQKDAAVTGEIGTITRADGSIQVTLGGHPLYYFANDKAAGEINGQGLNGKWFAAGPDGTGLGMAAPASSSGSGKGNY